eukprot:6235659-Prymnesium_polylepis.1
MSSASSAADTPSRSATTAKPARPSRESDEGGSGSDARSTRSAARDPDIGGRERVSRGKASLLVVGARSDNTHTQIRVVLQYGLEVSEPETAWNGIMVILS